MGYYDDYQEYVPVAERKKRAEKAVDKLRKKQANIAPVYITGRAIAKTWWGKAWCSNLESYADYANRIDRGRSYVRHGAVLDLQIASGKVTGLVQGSASKPYQVVLSIAPLSTSVWKEMVDSCAGKIDSLQDLAEGKLPKALSELFTMKGKGLFPAPKEISLACSCPDGARMCKHVAAILYGVGARLDENSELFFVLRSVSMRELVASSLAAQSQGMLEKSKGRTRRAIADKDLSAVFGVDIDSNREG